MSKPNLQNRTVYLRHSSGATHAFSNRKLAKLLKELQAGRGQPEMVALLEAGYTETLGGCEITDLTFETLYAEACGQFGQ